MATDNPGIGYGSFLFSLVGAVGLTPLCVFHARAFYQDFYTKERLSVGYRRKKPDINKSYKLVAWCTLLNVFLLTIYAYAALIRTLVLTETACRFLMQLAVFCIFTARFLVFCIFTLRLHIVYSGTKYEHSPLKLKIILGFVFVFEYGYAWFFQAYAAANYSGDWDMAYFNIPDAFLKVCEVETALWYGPMYVLVDLIINIYYCVSFIKPIRDVIKNIDGSLRNLHDQSKLTRKMITVGLKVTILTVTLVISSTLGTFLYIGLLLNIFGFDSLINALCVAFMTPYYPNEKFYYIYCKCCIKCCDCKGYTEKSAKYEKQEQIDLEAAQKNGSGDDDKDIERTMQKSINNSEDPSAPSGVSDGGVSSTKSNVAMSATSIDSNDPSVNGESAISGGSDLKSIDTASAVRVGANAVGATTSNENLLQ